MQDFVPDRFMAGEGQVSHHPYAYIPFGAGPRKCIGYRSVCQSCRTLLHAYARQKEQGVSYIELPWALMGESECIDLRVRHKREPRLATPVHPKLSFHGCTRS